MKSIRNFLLIAIIIFVVSACAPKATRNPPAPQPRAVASTSSTEAATQTAPQPTAVASTSFAIVAKPATATKTDAEMEALIFEKVHDKHTVEFILSQNKTAGQWSSTLDMMIGLGAKISPEEKTLIINWLVGRKK